MALENVNNALSKFESDNTLFDRLNEEEKKELGNVKQKDCKYAMNTLNESTVKTLGVTLDELMETFEFKTNEVNGKTSYECFVTVRGEKKKINSRSDLWALIQMYILAKWWNVWWTWIDWFIWKNTITWWKNVGVIKSENLVWYNGKWDVDPLFRALEAWKWGKLTEEEKEKLRKKSAERQRNNEKEQAELKRIYELKDSVKTQIDTKWMTYREIDDALKHRDDFVYDDKHPHWRWATPRERYNAIQQAGNHPNATEQEKYIAEWYRTVLDAKHKLEEDYPDLKRRILCFSVNNKDVYMESDNTSNPDYDL